MSAVRDRDALGAERTPSASGWPGGAASGSDGVRGAGRRGGWLGVVAKVVRGVLLAGFALAFLYPFAWLLAASLKPRGEVFDNRLIPLTFSPDPPMWWAWRGTGVAFEQGGC